MLPTSFITGHAGSTHTLLYQVETLLIFVPFWSVSQTVKHGDY
jgi:hypothetical protein